MTRRAILVLSAAHKGIAAARADLADVKDFLGSDVGGSWSQSEIEIVSDASAADALGAISDAASCDFSLVYFLGPTRLAKGSRPWAEIQCEFAENVALTERELNPGTPRCLQIFDGTTAPLRAGREIARKHFTAHGERLRQEYDDALLDAEAGIVKVSAQPKAPSDMRSSMTFYLLEAATELARAAREPQTINAVVARAQELALKESEPFAINYAGGRRMRHFPFATNV